MLAIISDVHRDIAGFLKIGRFSEAVRDGELRFYTSNSIPHVVASTGAFRPETAAQSVGQLISRFSPEIIVPAGIASSVSPNISTGGIVVCDRIVAVEGPAYTWGKEDDLVIETNSSIIENIIRQLNVEEGLFETGGCLTLPQFISKSPMKEWLGSAFDAATVDMEVYWIADAVRETRRPCVPVKVVMDVLGQEFSPRAFETLRYPLARRILSSTGYVAGNPLRIFEVARLAAQVAAARKSLAQFLYRLARTRLAMGRN